MTDLFWPGDERAGDLFTDAAVLARHGRASSRPGWPRWRRRHRDLRRRCSALVGDADRRGSRGDAEAGGNPVIPLLALLRERLGDSHGRRRLAAPRPDQPGRPRHRPGALPARDVRPGTRRARDPGRRAGRRLADRAPGHPDGRPHPDPARGADHLRSEGGRLADGVLDAPTRLDGATLPIQFGGAAGTLAARPRAGRFAAAVTSWPPPRLADCRPRSRGTPAARRSPGSATRWSAAPTPGGASPTTC